MSIYNCEISVIMPVYNTKDEWLRAAIESILNQTFKDFEFIIVLDGPTDNSKSIVREYSCKDSRIKIINHVRNEGIVKSLNDGLNAACGRYIARMDSDDTSTIDRLYTQRKRLIENSYDFVASRAQMISSNGEKKVLFPPDIKKSWDNISSSKLVMLLKCMNYMLHPTWLMKKELYQTLGGYREIPTCEDYDFLLRACAHNYQFGMIDKPLINCRITDNGISGSSLLKQAYTAQLLRKSYNYIDKIDSKTIDENLNGKITKEMSESYRKGFRCMTQSARWISKFHFIKGVIGMINAVSAHPHIISELVLNVWFRFLIRVV